MMPMLTSESAKTTRSTAMLESDGEPLMRILHIIATLNPAAGGPTESVRVLLSYGPIGYTGEVVTLDDPKASFLKEIPFPVHALGPFKRPTGSIPNCCPGL